MVETRALAMERSSVQVRAAARALKSVVALAAETVAVSAPKKNRMKTTE